jgi:hypothetical protein
MSDEDKNKTPETDDSQLDDDLESLSDDEKSAFEKIMAEITPAEGKPAAKPGESTQVDTLNESAPKASPETKESSIDAEDPKAESESETSQHASDKSSSDVASAQSEAPPQNGSEENNDELTEEQQAALDKIMAEIEGQPQPDESSDTASADPADDDTEEELSDDQQAALDKIMGEINERKEAPAPQAAEETPSTDDPEKELSDDQQAAPDKNVGEINERDEAPAPPAAEEALSTDDPEKELSDDQQAALDKIMGEINERKEAPAPQAAEETPSADDSEKELSEDQQAALDNIMAEINSSGQSTDSEQHQSSDEHQSAQPTTQNDPQESNLSIEEFNEELTNLLSDSEGESADSEAEKQPKQPASPIPADEKDTDPQEQAAPYTMLKEVTVSANSSSSAGSKQIALGAWPRGIKKALHFSAAISVVIALIGLGAWAYRFINAEPSPNAPEIAATSESMPMIEPEPAGAPMDNGESTPQAQAGAAAESQIPQESPFTLIRHDLEDARELLAAKKKELQDLKTYYQKGILEEQSKITSKAASAKLIDYREATKNGQVQLALRSIQRRMIYRKKLDTPLNQIDAALEELLYWQRRTQLLELLSSGISGLPVSEFKQEVERIAQQHLEKSRKLSVENIKVSKPKLAAIWKELTGIQTGRRAVATGKTRPDKKDLAIGKEICSENFEHLYLLTSISDEAAACLIRWSGKDLYLNGLTHLSPEAARSLAQWPGERLSLNGIRTLSAGSAKHLAQWPGKWLSLNGLTHLSSEATTYLAQWQGEQLEMVGLDSIGRWENYVTRLYLSEELRRKLEMQ